MAIPNIDSFELKPDFDPSAFRHDHDTGFYIGAAATEGLARFVGFGAPFGRASEGGGFDQAEVVHPLTDFEDLPSEHWNSAKQGKGIGPRMHNAPEAVLGQPGGLPDSLGIYTFDMDPERILILKDRGALRTILRHAGVLVRSASGGLERVTQRVHESYGEHQAVLWRQPPRAVARQFARGGSLSTPPKFMIIRDQDIDLYRVGSYAQDDLH